MEEASLNFAGLREGIKDLVAELHYNRTLYIYIHTPQRVKGYPPSYSEDGRPKGT